MPTTDLKISIEKLGQVRKIITHDSCADGTASAIILKDAFYGRAVEIEFVQYGTDAHRNLTVGEGVLFCDITPTIEQADAFVEAGALVLDHHRTARPIVEKFGLNGVFADETLEPGVCGAVLAYRHAWEPLRENMAIQGIFVREFMALAGIRDTWQRRDPRWHQACAQASVLNFIPNNRWLARDLTTLASTWGTEYEWLGQLLQEKQSHGVKSMIAKGVRLTSQKGTKILAIPSTHTTSDVAEALGRTFDIIVGFAFSCEDGQNPIMVCSTRSHADFDCSALAKWHGGGGHTKAAGFSTDIQLMVRNPYDHIIWAVDVYERGLPSCYRDGLL